MNSNPQVKRPQPPTVVEIDGRRYMTVGAVERYLAELVAFAQGGDAVIEERPEFRDNSLVKFRAVAKRLGTCVRTLERRIGEAKTQEAA